MEDLCDVGCARHVAKMSIKKEALYKSEDTPLENVCYKFFMLPKEVHNTTTKFDIRKALLENDRGCICIKIARESCACSTIHTCNQRISCETPVSYDNTK